MDEIKKEFYEFQLLEETEIPKSPSNGKYPGMTNRTIQTSFSNRKINLITSSFKCGGGTSFFDG